MKDELYAKYTKELKQGRDKKNKYEEALALANLNIDKRKVYKLLNASIATDTIACERILYFNKLNQNHGFKTVLVKLDSTAWQKICEKCITNYSLKFFKSKSDQDSIKYIKYINNYDSTNYNRKLIKELNHILTNDQLYRSKTSYSNNSNEEIKQKAIDTENLKKIDSIITIYGMPSASLVSPKYTDVVWIVLQHQSDIKVRDKYYPFLLESNKNGLLSDGLLYIFELRSANKGNSIFKYKL